ncbi:MAG: hypothetical protein AB1635_20010 [Acidobacteriota bacterium]
MQRLALAWALAACAFLSPVSAFDRDEPAGIALSADEQAAFLREARVTAVRAIGKGVTRPLRLTLTDGTITHDAAFQRVDMSNAPHAMGRGVRPAGELRFVDAYRYNIAAYRLARLVGVDDMMPVTVERYVNGERGALSWWVDDVMFDDAERDARGLEPPDRQAFLDDRQRMLLFAELVGDTDRNQGNVLFTRSWRLVMIDFTRAFRLDDGLRLPGALQRAERGMLSRIRALTEREIRGEAGRHLTVFEIRALLARRDRIVAHYDRLAAARGADAVFY